MALIRIDSLPQSAVVWTPDDAGIATPNWTAGDSIDIFVQPLASEEDFLIMGVYPSATHKAFAQLADEGETGIRVRYVVSGRTYEQVGPTRTFDVGKLDHLEIPLEEVFDPEMS